MTRLESFAGLNAVITGASSGIGRCLAKRVAKQGAHVALVARREKELESLANEIRQDGGESWVVPCDISDRKAAMRACSEILEHFGHVDLLVNNAGYGHHRTFLEWDLDDMERMMRTNYFGSLYFTKFLLPQMVERRRGWLTFISSVAGRIASPEESAYAASKFALSGFAEALSIEVESSGVHVLSVFPGVIRTPFFDDEAM